MNYGVHEEHCCVEHGCKYSDVNCPVTRQIIQQKYPCEICNLSKEQLSEFSTKELLEELLRRNYEH